SGSIAFASWLMPVYASPTAFSASACTNGMPGNRPSIRSGARLAAARSISSRTVGFGLAAEVPPPCRAPPPSPITGPRPDRAPPRRARAARGRAPPPPALPPGRLAPLPVRLGGGLLGGGRGLPRLGPGPLGGGRPLGPDRPVVGEVDAARAGVGHRQKP